MVKRLTKNKMPNTKLGALTRIHSVSSTRILQVYPVMFYDRLNVTPIEFSLLPVTRIILLVSPTCEMGGL
jgi:hypothetical protein